MKTKIDSQVRGAFAYPVIKMLTAGAALLTATLAFGQAAKPADETQNGNKEDVVKMEKVEVTGSRIKRLETEGPSPISIVTHQDLQMSGYVNLVDFIRNMPEATATATNEGSTLGFVRGASALDLRGLGMQNTLTIVNGRRVPLTGSAQSDGSTFVDMGRFPLSMIERIEILKDGASAIYGSDATAGVVNIITRKDYNGLELSMSYGNTLTKTDVAEKSVSIFGGVSTGKLRATIAASYTSRNGLKAIDTDFAQGGDFTNRAVAERGQDETWMGDATLGEYIEYYGIVRGFFDKRSSNGSPIAQVSVKAGGKLPGTTLTNASVSFTSPYRQGTNGTFNEVAAATYEPVRTTTAHGVEVSNLYDALKDSWLVPEMKQTAFSASLKYDFSSKIEGYLDVGYVTKESYLEFAPPPISSLGDNGIYVPATNYWNPFGVDVNFFWRLTEAGPRKGTISYDTYSILAGIKGTLLDRFDWDIGYTYGKDKATDMAENMLSESRVRAALARTDSKALNIFGGDGFKNDPDTLKSLFITTSRVGDADLSLIDAKISGPVAVLPWSGELQAAVYAEYREETFNTKNDAISSILDDVIGQVASAPPTSSFRSIKSIAAEIGVPLVRKATIPFVYSLDLSIAARFEDFSDGYNSGVKPYYGLRWQLDKNTLLRASYTQTFRAPSLSQLFAGNSQGLLQGLPDPSRPDDLTGDISDSASFQRLVISGGNPQLKPEKAESYQIGAVVDVGYVKWLKGLSVEVTYGQIEQRNVITSVGPDVILDNEHNTTGALVTRDGGAGGSYTNNTTHDISVYTGPGMSGTPGSMTVVKPGQSIVLPNKISSIYSGYVNMAAQQIRYVDFVVKYDKKFTNWGRVLAGVKGTYNIFYGWQDDASSGEPKDNYVDTTYYPRYRIQSSVAWEYKRWAFSLTNSYMPGNGKVESVLWRTGCYSIYGAQAVYRVPAGTVFAGIKLAVTIDNVFDREPPFSPRDSQSVGYQQYLIGRPQGRFISLSMSKEF